MSEEEKAPSPIVDELRVLGQQLAGAIKALWESEDTRKVRAEIGEGIAELGKQIDTAVKSAQESEAAKQFGAQVKETVEKARESDIATKVEQGLIAGLRELNEQLGKFVDSFQKPDEPTGGEGGAAEA